MKKMSILFLAWILIGCAGMAPNYSALPPEATAAQKRDALIADARLKLEDKDFQEATQQALILAGSISLTAAELSGVSTNDIQDIKNQFFTIAKLLDNASTGKLFTADELKALGVQYGITLPANNQFLISASSLYTMLRPVLAAAQDGKLVIIWMQIGANAARAIAGCHE